MTGPANAIIDEESPMVLPQTQVSDEILDDEKKLAKYSKSAEFKRLKEFMEARIEFYQKFLPDGTRVQDAPADERNAYWQAACIVTNEFQNVLNEYVRAAEAVKEHGRG